jgi:hypothetical protein
MEVRFVRPASRFGATARQATYGGDLDSTEIWFRRMRAEDHPPR